MQLKNIEFYGKHAQIIEKLSVTQENESIDTLGYDNPPLFNRMLDTMFIAGLIGLISKKKGIIDKVKKPIKTIFSDTVYKNMNDINFYSAIPIIKDRDLSKTIEVKRALFTENDELEENYTNKRFELFYSYVLGGLEILDEEILQQDLISEVDIFVRFQDYLEELLDEGNKINLNIDDLDFNLDRLG